MVEMLPVPQLMKYDAMILAIAEAKSADEVMNVKDRADALRAAAKIAKNKRVEIDCAEIRLRAVRRLGEMVKEDQEAGNLALNGQRGKGRKSGFHENPLSLSSMGIDKNLANSARSLSSTSSAEFERQIKDWREDVEKSNARVTTKLATRGRSRQTQKEGKAT
jgi:hypothetical protein